MATILRRRSVSAVQNHTCLREPARSPMIVPRGCTMTTQAPTPLRMPHSSWDMPMEFPK